MGREVWVALDTGAFPSKRRMRGRYDDVPAA